MSKKEVIEFIDEQSLVFDSHNPRLVEYINSETVDQKEIEKILWVAMDAREIALSILANGFFQTEPLIVDASSGKNIVIEGNRRLAAVRMLKNYKELDDPVIKNQIEKILAQHNGALPDLEKLPVLFRSREESWRLLGFKHVNGPARWGSYAKAQYITNVHREYGIPLDDIAFQIGDAHGTVQRLYKGIMILEQAEREKIFSRDNRVGSRLFFSHLYTGMQRVGVQDFLGLKADDFEDPNPVPEGKLDNLGLFLQWLYGNKEKEFQPLIKTQNPDLKNLDIVLQHPEALYMLKANMTDDGFVAAVEATRPASERFSSLLVRIKDDLRKARGLVTEGFACESTELKIAEIINDLSYDLYYEMERMMDKKKRSPRSESKI